MLAYYDYKEFQKNGNVLDRTARNGPPTWALDLTAPMVYIIVKKRSVLMIAKSDIPNINDKPPEGAKPEGGSYRVLVVDDSMFIAKQLGQIFTSEGFELAGTAADGAQGVELYKSFFPNIDLVTMDITMPVMDGVTALEKILEFDKNACVIMVSALGKEDVVKKSLLTGAKSYIVKPLDRKKVLERVVSVLKR
jgi:two-component system chemotaxis response regulator CheY